jgi:hypothetical protein
VRSFNWSGNVQDTFEAQRRFQQFFVDTVDDAVKYRVDLKVDLHSWANFVAGGIRVENNDVLDTTFKKAAIAGIKIEIASIGSPYFKSFGRLELKYPGVVSYRNYFSQADAYSFPSVFFNPLQRNIMVNNVAHEAWFNYSMEHTLNDYSFRQQQSQIGGFPVVQWHRQNLDFLNNQGISIPGIRDRQVDIQLYRPEIPRVWERNYFINQINSSQPFNFTRPDTQINHPVSTQIPPAERYVPPQRYNFK